MSSTRGVRLLALLALAMLLGSCGNGSDETRDSVKPDRDDSAATTTDTEREDDGEDEAGEPTALPEPTPEGELPPIVVESPRAFEQLVSAFELSGTAQVHEGTLAWAILDAKLRPMVQGRSTASCGAPCRGKFQETISLMKVPVGSWELHVWSPNAADDGPARLHDTMVPITVASKRTPGAPAPGTEPPGGAPQS